MNALPEELFDGYAVYKQIEEATGKSMSPKEIAYVLDAVVVLIKKRLGEHGNNNG